MNDTLQIRRADLADVASVIALAHEIWHRHYPGIVTAEQIDYMLERGYSPAALAPFVTDPTRGLALAERAAQPLGFAAWYPPVEPATMKLDKLYVLPQLHGQGIGRMLIEHVAAAARRAGCTTLTLNVNRNNTTAIGAYERCGFQIVRSGDFPIGNGFVMEDYIMARPLE
jgi:diamine N-acetyltransferase